MADSDDLARTATAVASAQGPTAPALGTTLGRYRLERTLGEGGMGVVHAAFDPDLERRVALKVLRKTDVGGDARQRLLREARAMARLTHENVVVVHEVGTAGDRDYVAMELIDGQTLAEWLAAEPREVAEIVAAFRAAGCGLAAAHAAGLVHRDFKPHNVLRRRDGKIVVTDFGLARGVENAEVIALDTTLELGAGSQPSGLSGITATGSVLGTPAYMAPEQWVGGIVGPPADQFAFCVALWEALTGARPFKGATIDELKAEVKRGPARLDASKLPRRLRRILVRGLDPDPAKRWPSMDAMLAAIRRADRRVGLTFMAGGGALVAASVAMVALHHSGSSCDPPALDPSQVWQKAFGKDMPPELSELFNTQVTHWAVARATACTAEPLVRQVQLHCLDGALERLDVIRQAFGATPRVTLDDVAAEVVDPSVCLGPAPPRLGLPHTADAIAAYTEYAKVTGDPTKSPSEAEAFTKRPGLDACSRAVGLVAAAKATPDFQSKRALATEAVTSSEQCDDDRLHADVLLFATPLAFEAPIIGPRGMDAIKKADVAVQRVSEPQLMARVELWRADVANQQGHNKEALELCDHAIAAYENNGQLRYAIKAVTGAIQVRMTHGGGNTGRAQVGALIKRWLPIAKTIRADDLVRDLEYYAAYDTFNNGDVTAGHAALLKLWKQHADEVPPHPIEGEVVDREGKPVVGATVVSATFLVADSVGVPLPIYNDDEDHFRLRATATDAAGHFKFTDAAEVGAMMAQLGDRRSVPSKIVDHVTLVIEPTRRIAGKVDLGATPNTDANLIVVDPNDKSTFARFMAPLAPDGTFAIDGVPQGPVKLGIGVEHPDSAVQISYTPVPASKEPVTGLTMSVASSQRTLDVLARSTIVQPLESAQVVVLPGRVQLATVGELLEHEQNMLVRFAHHITGETVPKEAAKQYRSGDLIAHFTDVPEGQLTACAVGLPADLQDEVLSNKIRKHRGELEMRCETVDGDATFVLINTPPTKNLD
ncbi:MAG: serine/threonine-protein kinase [Kofleriaceae bacterium]